MRLVTGNEQAEFDNDETGVAQMIEAIQATTSAEQAFHYLLIDGVEVYDDYAEYLYENMDDVRVVQIQTISLQEYMQSLLVSAGEYLRRAIPAAEQLAAALYTQVDADTWQQIDQLLEGVQWLQESFAVLDTLPGLAGVVKDYEQWNLYSRALGELAEKAAAMAEPLKFGDHVSVSDIILYEIKPALEKLHDKLPALIQGRASHDY